MHILHITRDYPPLHKGGISTAVEGMTRALCARGLTVTVLSFDGWRPRTRRDGPAELALETLGSVEIARLSCPTQLKAAHGFVEARCPTQDPAQNIPASFVGRQGTVSDGKTKHSDVIGNHLVSYRIILA